MGDELRFAEMVDNSPKIFYTKFSRETKWYGEYDEVRQSFTFGILTALPSCACSELSKAGL